MRARAIRGTVAAVTGALMLEGCAGEVDSAPATVTETVTHMATATVTHTVEGAAETTTEEATTEAAAPEDAPFLVYELEERFEFADSGLTVKGVEVLDAVETNDGSALQAREGYDITSESQNGPSIY